MASTRRCEHLQDLIQQRLKALYFRARYMKLPSAAETVRRHPLFSHLSQEDLKQVLEVGDTHLYDCNTKLFEAGQTASRVFIILRGTVSQQVRSLLHTGAIYCISGWPDHRISATSLQDCRDSARTP